MHRDINFFSVYRSQSENSTQGKLNLILLSSLAGTLIIVLAIFTILKFLDLSVVAGIDSNNNYINGSEVAKARSINSSMTAKIVALNQYKLAAERVSYGFSLFGKPDSALMASVASMEPADVKVISAAYTNSTLLLTCSCSNNISPAAFAHTLDASGQFAKVNYNGVLPGNTSQPANQFLFTVLITLKGGASSQ